MKKRFFRTLTCRDGGKISMVLAGMFSMADIKAWAEQYESVEVGGGSRVYEVRIPRPKLAASPEPVAAAASLASYPTRHHYGF